MNEAIKTIDFKNGQKLEIYLDVDNESPRDWDNVTTMICKHKHYNLGDYEISQDFNFAEFSNWDEVENAIIEKYHPEIIKPLYLLDHSGLTISTRSFYDKWDSGMIGFVFISKDTYQKEYENLGYKKTQKELEKILDLEVKIYNQYLTGEIYSFCLFDAPKQCKECNNIEVEILESCSGFYDIKDIVEYLDESLRQEFLDNI